VFPEAFLALLGLVIGLVAPILLPEVVPFIEDPVVVPLIPPAVDPLPESPLCASANVLVRANAVASTIVVSFMVLSFSSFREATTAPSVLSFH
jgi:hypothetical protein